MLKYSHGLYFPELVIWKKDVNFKSWQEKGTTNIYILDWSIKDKKIGDKRNEWLSQHRPKKIIPVHNTLPQKWENWLSTTKFAIPSKYYKEITNQTHKAIEEWNGEYPFDTVIRDMCLQAAIAHVAASFKLIADCAYDSSTNYFSRSDDKILLKHALMYRFWIGQTGGGLLQDHSEFHHLKWLLTSDIKLWHKDNILSMRHNIEEFINDIDKYEKECNEQYSVITEPGEVEELPINSLTQKIHKSNPFLLNDDTAGPSSFAGDPA